MAEETQILDMRAQFEEALQTAKDTFTTIYTYFCEQGTGPFVARVAACLPFVIVLAGQMLMVVAVNLVPKVFSVVAVAILTLVAKARHNGQPELNKVIAAAMGEFMGVEFSGDDLPGGGGIKQQTERARAIGAKFHNVLLEEFKPDGLVSPESGDKAAKAFTGYNINFSVGNAYISILSELFSLHHLEQMRELGVEVAENLGLGRLHRQALMPLVRNLVAEPYDQKLKHQFRPDRLGDAQIFEAFHSGRWPLEKARQELAYKGYRDEFIDELLIQTRPHLGPADLYKLVLAGRTTMDGAVEHLMTGGTPKEVAQLLMDAQLEGDVLARENQLITEIIAKAKSGFFDPAQADFLISRLHVTDREKQIILEIIGVHREKPAKRLTFAQVEALYVATQFTLSEFDDWADDEGYSREDSFNLEILLLLKRDASLDKKKKREESDLRLAARAAARIAVS